MEYQCDVCTTPCNIFRKIWARIAPSRCKHCSRLKEREEAVKKTGEQQSEFLKKPRCKRKVINIVGGAKLEVRGGFDLVCVGDSCVDYPCEQLKR